VVTFVARQMNQDPAQLQRDICAKYATWFEPCLGSDRAGLATSTLKLTPSYGVRMANSDGSSSWYIWNGPRSESPDFFQPVHAAHLAAYIPSVIKYLGLPPGFRFIIDEAGYEDVWFEPEVPEA